MPATSQQSEAIKLIGDWAKWIVAVETGAIAAIGIFGKGAQNRVSHVAYVGSVGCFALSIMLASMVLLSLPAAVQDIDPHEKVWDRVCAIGPFQPSLRIVVGGQFLLFVVGIGAFAVGVIGSLLSARSP